MVVSFYMENKEIVRLPYSKLEVKRTLDSTGDSVFLKHVSLVSMVVQYATQILLMRHVRTRNKEHMFLATSAIFCTEIVKFCLSVLLVLMEEKSFMRTLALMHKSIILQPFDTAKVCVPSVIYTIQNNLLFIAVSSLTPATLMVTYQLKILTTALFAVILLNKQLSPFQWLSLLLLFVGVSTVQMAEQTGSNKSNNVSPTNDQALFGLLCVIIACVLSGFSGIYFEKILKTSDLSLWMRNIQLAVLSVPISGFTMLIKDSSQISQSGIFNGYDYLVWIVVFVNAMGGLNAALVMRYADNILKGFATSLSIIISCIASVYLFNFQPTGYFLFGILLVVLSLYLYSKFPPNNMKIEQNGGVMDRRTFDDEESKL